MARLLLLGRREVEDLLDLEQLREALGRALVAISDGLTSVPPRVAAWTQDGLLAAMPGFVPGLGLGAKLVTVFPESTPSHQGVVVLFDEASGTPAALLDGEAITALRTAMSAAVAAKALAPSAASIAVLGSGVQAASHLRAFAHVYPAAPFRLAARSPARAAALGFGQGCDSFEEAVRGADIVCCCTASPDPVVEDSWIEPGVHVSSVGTGRELPAGLVERAELFVESKMAAQAFPAGTRELEGFDPARLTEIGSVLAGRSPGRSGPQAVTVYKSMGHAAEDMAAAAVVLRRATESGVGLEVEI